ncbi:MAG: hypothetical protein Q8L68_06095, partial [Methylococcales bacterium]|nr:hypothetical protein [Methylococcales bacterium]
MPLIHFIEHMIEPSELLLAWQSLNEHDRTRYIVGKLSRTTDDINLQYSVDTDDFRNAEKHGFTYYPAFPNIDHTHHHVLDAFMRRLPPRTRGDFTQYLQAFRIKPDAAFTDFALL